MDKELQELAFALMDKAAHNNIAKVSIQSGDVSITVETHAPAAVVTAAAPVQTAASADAAPAAPAEEPVITGTVVNAPLVGTFYAAGAPEQPPLVAVGDRVQRGQTLCIIEAMKTMNSIECPCDGVVSRIMVENGDLVEYNQPLIVIE